MDLNVLIVGGGIHGIGLLHDLSSRQIPDVMLVEKYELCSGTSSRSTKLLHGGLRYLEHLSQWELVWSALQERTLFFELFNDIVKPVPFILTHEKSQKRNPFIVQTGLFLYDFFSGDSKVPKSKKLTNNEIIKYAPYLKNSELLKDLKTGFLYYDGKMIDDVLARVAAQSAVKMGGKFQEHTEVVSIEKWSDGYKVTLKKGEKLQFIKTKFLINATGAWANANLLHWGITPNISCLLNLGTHLLFSKDVCPEANLSQSAATLIQEPSGRVVFFIPWFDKWLLGTTESVLHGAPEKLIPPKEDIDYLLKKAKDSLNLYLPEGFMQESFCGVRCMPLNRPLNLTEKITPDWQRNPYASPFYTSRAEVNISELSRETIIDSTEKNLISIYGGKWTTYRREMKKLGLFLSNELGLGGPSLTHCKESWFLKELKEEMPELFQSKASLRHY